MNFFMQASRPSFHGYSRITKVVADVFYNWLGHGPHLQMLLIRCGFRVWGVGLGRLGTVSGESE